MNIYRIEHGCFFHEHEIVNAESESALHAELMRPRPEIFPVQIVKLPELTLEPKYQDTWHQKPRKDVPFVCGGWGMKWTQQQVEWLKDLYPDTSNTQIAKLLGRTEPSVLQKAIKLGLKKSPEYMATNPGGFKQGLEPWNKGRKWDSGGRSAQTRFKKGQAPHNSLPIGHERLTKDGIWERKVADTRVKAQDWRPIHVLEWEKVNGPVPNGHIVVFKDRNRENFAIENLECISRAENMQRNSVHRLPKEVAELVQLMGALNRQINKRI